MTIRPGSEFNIVGAPSEELKCHLLYLATIDSDAVHSGYKSRNSVHAGAEARNTEQADAFLSLAQLVMANQKRIDVLSDKLNGLDDASYQALIETEERLEQAREELERIRAQAYEITLPDGTVVKVYRDSDAVRSDTGDMIDPAVISADDIPNSLPDWARRKAAGESIEALERQRDQIIDYRQALDAGRDKLGDNPSDEDLDELEAALDEMPDAVERHYSPHAAAERPLGKADRSASFATELTGPALDGAHKTLPAFNRAVQDHSPESTAEHRLPPPDPDHAP